MSMVERKDDLTLRKNALYNLPAMTQTLGFYGSRSSPPSSREKPRRSLLPLKGGPVL